MTTKVMVHANHGWPVNVIRIGLPLGAHEPPIKVGAGESREFSVHSGADLLIHEIQPGESQPVTAVADEPILRFFAYAHLPQHLQKASMPFAVLADMICRDLPRNAERSVALRKLLEAKDAAVRAAIS